MSKAIKAVTRAVTAVFTGGLSETSLFDSDSGGGGQLAKPGEKPVAPKPDDEETRRLRERETQRRFAGGGRSGTILTPTSRLG